MNVSLQEANRIVEAALEAARARRFNPLTIAVLDSGGHLVAFNREDHSGILRPQISIAKAWGALGMGESSRAIGERLGQRPQFLNALAIASEGRIAPVPGGVLVYRGQDDEPFGPPIGAVGVSGDRSEHDERVAIIGIRTAGLVPDPARPAPELETV